MVESFKTIIEYFNLKTKLYIQKLIYLMYFLKQPPFIIKDSDSPRGYKGYCIELINEIAKKVGFDYEIKEVEDGKFGSLNEKVFLSLYLKKHCFRFDLLYKYYLLGT